MHRALFAVVIAATIIVGMAPPHRAAAIGVASPHRAAVSSDPCPTDNTPCYYLALGDSLAYGYQPNLDLTHGYANDLLAALNQKYPTMQLERLGCVGETTSTMLGLNGSTCPYWQYTTGMTTTPQITQTLDFLTAHQGQVHLITLDIGANDALQILLTHPTSATLVTFLNQFSTNLDQILTQVQAAANQTGNQNAPIIVMTNYNPLAASSNSLFIALAGTIFSNKVKKVVANHPGVSVADVYSAFNGGPNPGAVICQATWWCNKGDLHANRLGYKIMAAIFWQAGAENV